jgi:hypothetical protein
MIYKIAVAVNRFSAGPHHLSETQNPQGGRRLRRRTAKISEFASLTSSTADRAKRLVSSGYSDAENAP